MKKRKYLPTEMEIVEFDVDDVITASGEGGGDDDDDF